MRFRLTNGYLSAIIILMVIIADQILKIWVKTHFYLYESLEITSWFKLNFIENPGMAFGIELGSKLFLTLFRIIASIALIYILIRIRNNSYYSRGFFVCLSLITAGAIGNVIDCMFYGMIFSESTPYTLAQIFPDAGGYASFLHGKVVDMFYFPIASWDWPEWMPGVGGEHFIFFQPVFNLADAAISAGIIAFILFYSKYLASNPEEQQKKAENNDL
ncbi:MAG: lipoprotein signal peptidase [Bacteroidetes bacterium]|uniref:Lipoprotein signal peptidase n=1 Tax=Candidatus Limisoma faecipullorum TaxID=2840854 RepID=A0A9D9NKH8_9BACT|nr:lipoprotein signal peptidase [Candidatus Limisoma faecipullorum]